MSHIHGSSFYLSIYVPIVILSFSPLHHVCTPFGIAILCNCFGSSASSLQSQCIRSPFKMGWSNFNRFVCITYWMLYMHRCICSNQSWTERRREKKNNKRIQNDKLRMKRMSFHILLTLYILTHNINFFFFFVMKRLCVCSLIYPINNMV